MDKQKDRSNREGESYEGYDTPGDETIVKSSSSAVPSPTQTADERVDAPKSRIESIGETPGDANPALAETIGAAEGKVSTADLLRAREAAEEQGLRQQQAHIYQTQPPDVSPDEFEEKDAGRPTWPSDRQNPPIEQMDAPHAEMPYLTTTGVRPEAGFTDVGRFDAEMDKNRAQAGAGESRSGLDPTRDSVRDTGFDYEAREMEQPSEQSEMDRLAPDMTYTPPEDDERGR